MFNKALWNSLIRFISIDDYPKLPCPNCSTVALELDEHTFEYRTLPHGAISEDYLARMLPLGGQGLREIYEQNNVLGLLMGVGAALEMAKFSPAKFTCFLECKACQRHVSATGTAAIPNQPKRHERPKIKIEYFSPTVDLFPLQRWTPASISVELRRAFSYFHSDLTASGAKIRRAVEQFCIELGYSEGNLHKRIQKMADQYPQEAQWLQSLRWFGNEATHADNINEADLLHSFEILEELLDVFRRVSRLEAVQAASLKLEQKFKK